MKGKILYIASTFSHIRNFHLPYLRYYQEQGFEVHAAGNGNPGEIPGADRLLVIPFKKRMFSLCNFKAAFQLAALIRREGYDIVSVHTSLAAFFTRLGVLFSFRRPKLVVNTVHGYLFSQSTPFFKRSLFLLAEKLLKRQTDLILTMNREDYDIARKYKLCRRDNVFFINGMGIAQNRFPSVQPKEKLELREKYGLPRDAFVLVYAAEFSERKNQAFLISALSALPEEERGRIRLLLLGDGGMLEGCQALARKLGLGDSVLFPGYQSEVCPYYQLGDVAVSSSQSEGLPFNLMEAMAVGLPVVASKVKGHTDLVTPDKNGYLFPLDDVGEFCRCVQTLDRDPELRSKMGRCGREMVWEYSIERVFPAVTGILEEAWKKVSVREGK